MANNFSKQEMVAFEQVLEGFDDNLVLSKSVKIYNTEASEMERAGDTVWRPMPYIAQSFAGTDMTNNFRDSVQLSVPASISIARSSPFQLTARELRDAVHDKSLGAAATQKLASDINVALMNLAATSGTLVVKRSGPATGFDDVAACDATMNEQGVQMNDRSIALSTRDYNSMASDLAKRVVIQPNSPTLNAYERAFVGDIAGFTTLKLDYANRLTAAAGTTVTISGANQFYVPKATSTAVTGEVGNVDNRYQNVTIAVTGGAVKVGDCFTVADVFATHHITKGDTGQLKTFRITGIVTGSGGSGVVQISPPMISAQGGSDAERAYQNVTATPANGAAVTFLNTAGAQVNPFWHKDALEILPGNFVIPEAAGVAMMKSTTENGISLTMQKFVDIRTNNILFRFDTLFGVVNKQPQMSGIMLFNQT